MTPPEQEENERLAWFVDYLRRTTADPLHQVRLRLAEVLEGADPGVLVEPVRAAHDDPIRWVWLEQMITRWTTDEDDDLLWRCGVLVRGAREAGWDRALDDLR